jgi:hypothetical protein
MIVAAVVYMMPFVARGWIPHDEGMLGQSAEQVLHGGIPHIDYEETYTGGLSWMYAAVFKLAGVELLQIRRFLLAGAALAAWLMYAILRRFLAPTGSALATWVGVGWSFPNYFAGLPSWWLLVCALSCVWAFIRYIETGRWRYVVAAGLSVGVAIAVKQTGVYLLVALILSLLYDSGRTARVTSAFVTIERLVRWVAAGTAIVVAAVILAPRIFRTEGLYLFCPVAACAVVLFRRFERGSDPPLTLVCIATIVAALPLACLLMPYAIRHRLWDFVYGTVLLPQKRLAFASKDMLGGWRIITGVPLMALVFAAPRSDVGSRLTAMTSLLWAAAILWPIAALWNATSYQAIWQSSRAFAVLLPLGVCWRLASGRVKDPAQRSVLFVSSAMLAWTSLNQFPWSGPIYFLYVAPLAVIGGVAAASAEGSLRRHTMGPWAMALLLFAVLGTNREYPGRLGVHHVSALFDSPLNSPRAHLNVSSGEAKEYRGLLFSIERHLRGGLLIAGPDCPEVYFLSGLSNPSGASFDFFSESAANPHEHEMATWLKGEVIVLNHRPMFSPRPSAELLAGLRREFAYGEEIGRFEIRWR